MVNRVSSKYFSVILLLSCLLGFAVPDVGKETSVIILVFLFVVIFCSFFQLDFRKEAFVHNSKKAILYTALRYLAFPLACYYVAAPFSSFYAFTLFFLALMPAAVSSPAFANMFGANMNLSLIILVVSSFLVILTIPFLTPYYLHKESGIRIFDLFKTLMLTVFLPFVLHIPLRKSFQIDKWMRTNLPSITLVSLSLIFIFAISRNKSAILGNLPQLVQFLLVSVVFYTLLYTAGWFVFAKQGRANQISYAVSSGMNNIGLAVSLAALYLPAKVCIFLIVAEFAWVAVLVPVKQWFKDKPMQKPS
jgi:predicted Na+-dependent transporter